jgi:hypothetical protein
MPLEVDHVFIACAPGAPEADTLLQLGLVEGSPNTHPGQGTANRRFFFANFMLELLWVADAAEAERCSHRGPEVSPFGILFRTTGDADSRAPFRTWSYHPSYLPPDLAIEVAEGTSLQEPELFYLPFLRGARSPTPGPTSHSWALGRVRGLSVGVRSRSGLSEASRATEQLGLLTYFESREHVLEIHFQGPFPKRIDLRPVLPVVLSVAP